MKKILTIMLVFVLAFTLFVGCGDNKETEPVKEETQKEEKKEVKEEKEESKEEKEETQKEEKEEEKESKEEAKENIGTFNTTNINGEEVTQDIFKESDLTMVNVFSTMCNPCMQELPELVKINNEYKDKSFKIIGLLIDMDNEGKPDIDAGNEIKKIVDENFNVLFLDENLMTKVLTKYDAIPATFFVDKEGNIVGESYLGSKSKEEWEAIIKEKYNEKNN